MSPFVSRITKNDQWVWPISGMCVVLGFMISMAWVTDANRSSRFKVLEPGQRQRVSEAAVDPEAYADMNARIETLTKENTDLQNTLAKGKGSTQLLNKQLQDAKAAAGLTKVEGPGVIVTLRDSMRSARDQNLPEQLSGYVNIHDVDVLRIVNEIIAAGAEAVAVNDHRIAGLSSFRCVGPTILVNDVKIASPVIIKAIGDPATMAGGLNLNNGVLDEIRSLDPKMITVEMAKKMSVPAFSGRTEFRLGNVPKESS